MSADFEDWTAGITIITGAIPMGADFADWTEAIAVAGGTAPAPDAMLCIASILQPSPLFGLSALELRASIIIVPDANPGDGGLLATSTGLPFTRTATQTVVFAPNLYGFSQQATGIYVAVAAASPDGTQYLYADCAVTGPAYGVVLNVGSFLTVHEQKGTDLSLVTGNIVSAAGGVYISTIQLGQNTP